MEEPTREAEDEPLYYIVRGHRSVVTLCLLQASIEQQRKYMQPQSDISQSLHTS